MKKIIVPQRFNLVRNVERLQGKITVKQFIKKRFPECIGSLIVLGLTSIIGSGLTIIGVLCTGTFIGFLVLGEKYNNQKIAKKNLDHNDSRWLY